MKGLDCIEISNPGYAILDVYNLQSGQKLIKNKYIKMINDVIIKNDFPHHGFKYIRRALKISNTRYKIISDIECAINSNIKSIFYNRRNVSLNINPTYIIDDLIKIIDIDKK